MNPLAWSIVIFLIATLALWAVQSTTIVQPAKTIIIVVVCVVAILLIADVAGVFRGHLIR